MCEANFRNASGSNISDTPAHIAICDIIHKTRRKITMICLGPLTNLASAYIHDDSIKNEFREVYIMGGNRFGDVKFNCL